MTYHNIDPAAVSALKDLAAAGKAVAEALHLVAEPPVGVQAVGDAPPIPPAPISHQRFAPIPTLDPTTWDLKPSRITEVVGPSEICGWTMQDGCSCSEAPGHVLPSTPHACQHGWTTGHYFNTLDGGPIGPENWHHDYPSATVEDAFRAMANSDEVANSQSGTLYRFVHKFADQFGVDLRSSQA